MPCTNLRSRRCNLILVLSCLLITLVSSSWAQTITEVKLHSFSRSDISNGVSPNAIIRGIDGNFYGTCGSGGIMQYGYGTLFSMTPDGTLTTLHKFEYFEGYPSTALVPDAAGNLYGTTGYFSGPYGTIFRYGPDGTFTTLYVFSGSDGDCSLAPLLLENDGSLYGTTISGGVNNGGTIFKLAADGTFTTLYSFPAADNSHLPRPLGALARGPDGGLYGTTQAGGENNTGMIFKLATDGAFSILRSFAPEGTYDDIGRVPKTGLLLGSDGNFYGTTADSSGSYYNGNESGTGSLFKMTPTGALTPLHLPPEAQGINSLVRGIDGSLYATGSYSREAGIPVANTLLQITPDDSVNLLYSAPTSGRANGEGGFAPVLQAPDGTFYGAYPNDASNVGFIFHLVGVNTTPVGGVSFGADSYDVNQADGTVALILQRSNGHTGALSVNYATSDGIPYTFGSPPSFSTLPAQAGADYVATSGTVTWANGDASDKIIRVPIINRHLTNEEYTYGFSVTLSTPTNGAALFTPSQANVLISSAAVSVTSPLTVTAYLGTPFRYQVTTDNPSPISYAATGLPFGLNIDGASGIISGVPSITGVYSVALSIETSSSTATGTLTLTVTPPPPAPVITSATTVSTMVGITFTYQVTSTDPAAVLSVVGALPPGLRFDPATGTLTGKPTASGAYLATLNAVNGGGTGQAIVTFTVAPALLPVVTLTATTPTVTADSGDSGVFTLSLSAVQDHDVSVSFIIKGTAINGSDYVLLKTTKKIKAGKTSKPIKVIPLGRSTGTGAKRTVALTLIPGDGYAAGTTGKVKVKIIDQ